LTVPRPDVYGNYKPPVTQASSQKARLQLEKRDAWVTSGAASPQKEIDMGGGVLVRRAMPSFKP